MWLSYLLIKVSLKKIISYKCCKYIIHLSSAINEKCVSDYSIYNMGQPVSMS